MRRGHCDSRVTDTLEQADASTHTVKNEFQKEDVVVTRDEMLGYLPTFSLIFVTLIYSSSRSSAAYESIGAYVH